MHLKFVGVEKKFWSRFGKVIKEEKSFCQTPITFCINDNNH